MDGGRQFSANATLKDGETAVTLMFRFDENGLIQSAHADARGALSRAYRFRHRGRVDGVTMDGATGCAYLLRVRQLRSFPRDRSHTFVGASPASVMSLRGDTTGPRS